MTDSGTNAELPPQLAPAKESPKEIERKFLVKKLPENLDQYPHAEIRQGYLAITEDGTEVRLRQKGDKHYQTVKKGSGKERFEAEIEITEEQFTALWLTTEGKRVEKTRYNIPHEQGTIETDIYHGNLTGLVSAEMEFTSAEESDKFVPPEWLSQEVTDDQRYKNQNLAVIGLPRTDSNYEIGVKENLGIPEYKKEEGIEKLAEIIREKRETSKGNTVVEIAGGSASGKTSAVAFMIRKTFGDDAVILSADDYYRGNAHMTEEARKGNVLNWDQPEAVNLELFRQHLIDLKAGRPIEKPVYDFKTGESTSTETINPKKIIIAEGLFVLDDSVKDAGDVRAFIDIGTHGRIVRRLLRDVQRTGQKPEDILKYFAQVVEPMHEKYIESTKKNADLIINNEYNPEVEAERSGMHEIQLKFAGTIDQDDLRKLGAEKLSTTIQTDNYYDPKDRDLIKTGEILRIRNEGKKRTLTYKGPKVESQFRDRPKFEFDIDEETAEAFLDIYGNKRKTISKERTLYHLNGVILSVDRVVKSEDGKDTDLGSFIEIRSTDKDANEDNIRKVIATLGLDINNGIKESYFEM